MEEKGEKARKIKDEGESGVGGLILQGFWCMCTTCQEERQLWIC
jgi:hypothetical protein